METLEIRVQYKTIKKIEKELIKLISEIEETEKHSNIKVYKKINHESDFIILILNESDHHFINNSSLGLRLHDALKEYGMINYNKWNELVTSQVHK